MTETETVADAVAPRAVARAYLDVLAGEGYRPKVDDEGVDETSSPILFKKEGTTFVLFAYEDDPEYFRMGLSFKLGQGPHDAASLAEVANDLNDRWKGVKTVLDLEESRVRFAVETFLTGQKVSGALLERSTHALRCAADDFFGARRPPARLDS